MKKLDILIDSAAFALYMLISCLCCMFAEMLAVDLLIGKLLGTFIEFSPVAINVIRAAIYTLGVNAILAVLLYRDGYRSAEAHIGGTAISGAIGALVHFLFCLLFGFQAFCAGAVRSLSLLILHGSELSAGSTVTLTRLEQIPVYFVTAAIYVAVMIAARHIGANNRLADRSSLTGSTEDNDLKE